jgi:putative addiction module killer protein
MMLEVRKTAVFDSWLNGLADRKAKVVIARRLQRLELGNVGDAAPVGSGVSELRIHYGPGYRVYFVQRGPIVVVLLCGGDKGTQQRDIRRAVEMAQELEG